MTIGDLGTTDIDVTNDNDNHIKAMRTIPKQV